MSALRDAKPQKTDLAHRPRTLNRKAPASGSGSVRDTLRAVRKDTFLRRDRVIVGVEIGIGRRLFADRFPCTAYIAI